MSTYIKQSIYYLGSNNCEFLSNFREYNFKIIMPDKYSLFTSTWSGDYRYASR